MRTILHITSGLAACLLFTDARAQEGNIPSAPPINRPWPQSQADTVFVGDTLVVQWQQPSTPAKSYGIRDQIMLVVDPRWQVDTTPRDVRITLEVTATMNPDHGNFQTTANKDSLLVVQLEVGSRPLGDMPTALARALDEKSADGFGFTKAHRFKAVLVDVEVNEGSGYQDVPFLPKALRLENQLVYDRVLLLARLGQGPATLNASPIGCPSVNNGAPQELAVMWAAVDGADGYELEWSWVDNYGANGNGAIDPMYDLDRSATRVQTVGPAYRIPLLYDRGAIVYRVRAVGHDPYFPQAKVTTAWYGAPSIGQASAASPYLYGIPPHQKEKNWQVTTSFAEEGKHKEVMTYADGTTRPRQTVTRNNSLLVPIIGETIYDIVGRPALEIMPVPHVKAGCPEDQLTGGRIDYFPDFNREVDPNGDDGHDAIRFDDLTTNSSCTPTAPELHHGNGAEFYYSTSYADEGDVAGNPLLVQPPSFLPQAQGNPYAQTEYTKDNTGRVRTKGGVGELFKMGGHTTTSYYGKPEQLQLDRLFGSEAGYAHHFQKVVTTDPNGQVSISYIDMTGKTVATSLACGALEGGSIGPFLPLPSFTGGTVNATTDLFNGLPSTDEDLEQLQQSATGPAVVFTTTIAVPCAGSYTFDYGVTPVQLSDNCWQNGTLCVTCGYILDIYLENSCGEQVSPEFPIVNRMIGTVVENNGAVSFSCSTPQADGPEEQEVSLEPGEYTLTKVLRLNPATREAYVNALLQETNNICYAQGMPDDADLRGGLDLADCDVTCQECYEALGPVENFVLLGGTVQLYEDLKAECDEACTVTSWCSVAYDNMLTDVDLLGQYAKYTEAIDGTITVTDRASVFHANSVLLNPYLFDTNNGDPARNVTDLRDPWQQPWIEVDGVGYPEYRDENNERIKVDLLVVPGGFEPPVNANDVDYYDEAQTMPYTYPEHLLYLRDFFVHWRSGYERSLLRFHPEYCYYKDCQAYGEREVESDPLSSSDGFDQTLTETLTAEEAETAQFMIYPTGSVPVGSWVQGTVFNLLAEDPFGDQDVFAVYAEELAAKFANYTTIGGVNYSLPELAAVYARCGGNFNSTTPTMAWCRAYGYPFLEDGTTAVSADVLNTEWANLRAFYRAEKYRIQKDRGDDYVDDCGCAGLNYCISEPESDVWWDRMHSPLQWNPFQGPEWWSSYADYIAEYQAQWSAQPGNAACQPCSNNTYGYYTGKVRRIAEPGGAPAPAPPMASSGYASYVQTGQCPMASAWQMLFQELVPTGLLATGGTYDLTNSPAWQGIQLIQNDYVPATGTTSATVVIQLNGNVVNMLFDGSGIASCAATLTVPDELPDDGGDFLWADVSYVAGLRQSIGNAFQLVVYTANTALPVPIDGTLCEDYALSPCNFERICHTNDLGLAWQELLTDIAVSGNLIDPVPLTSLVLPGSGGLTVQSQVGLPIRARFSGNPTMQWSFSAAQASIALRGGTSPTAPQYTLNGLGTNPADEPLSYYLDHAAYFTDLNCNYENFFTVQVHGPDGEFLCTLSGQLWFTDAEGTVPLAMGECELPQPALCDAPEVRWLDDVVALVQERVQHEPFSFPVTQWNGMDLWESPFMTNELAGLICPSCTTNTGNGQATSSILGSHTMVDPQHHRFNYGNCLNIEVVTSYNTLINSGGIVFDHFGNINMHGDADEDGFYHAFTFDLNNTADGNSVYRGTVLVTTCFGIASCNPCMPVPEPDALQTPGPPETPPPQPDCLEGELTQAMALRWSDGTLTGLENKGVVKKDESWAAYEHYGKAVDSLNTRLNYGPNNPLRAQKITFQTFMDKGYSKTLDHYLNYLRNYIPAIDKAVYLAAIDSFVVEKGNTVNVESEYARYLKSVAEYNQRAQAAGKPLIVDVESKSSFAQRMLSDKNHTYVAYLAGRTPRSTLPLNITNYLNWQENTDPCAVLYRDSYLPAHATYLATIAGSTHPCYGMEQFTPLASYEEFIQANICCSDTGLAVLNAYLQALSTDTLPCPGQLPELAACSVDSSAVFQKFLAVDNECQRLYSIWKETLLAYLGTDYYTSTDYELSDKYKTFEEFAAAGLCGCVQEYLVYLQTYMDWEMNTPKPEKVRPIEEFCDPAKYCESWFDLLRKHVLDIYPQSAYYTAFHVPLTLQWTSGPQFVASGYCDCALSYINYLSSYVQWNGQGTPPPPIVQFTDYCDGVEANCCTNWDYMLQLQVAYKTCDYQKKYECKVEPLNWNCEKVRSAGYCYCLAEYIAYMQTYLDWEYGDPQLPCPMPLKDFCGSNTCDDAYNRYYGALVPAIAALGQYNATNNTAYAFYQVTDPALFTSAHLCYCVDAYVALLNLFVDDPEAFIAQHGFTHELESIVYQCQAPLACCQAPPPPQIIEPPAPEEDDPCEAGLVANLWINLQAAQAAYITTQTQNITDLYNSQCLNALETFTMGYPDTEHHFTLYYYDRAGNLVRTVPPEGVERKSFTSYDAEEALRIAADRLNGTHLVYTDHRLASDHVYNSLEQPIRMAMPDQDRMDIRETGPTTGLPENSTINGSWFGDGGKGYLVGSLSGGPVARGMAYSTSDGGVTWQRSFGLVGADLFGVHYPTALRGYAVGAHGTFLRTVDAGLSWDLIPNELLSNGSTWKDVMFRDEVNGMVVGPAGASITSTGDVFSQPAMPAQVATLTGIGYDGLNYMASGEAPILAPALIAEQGLVAMADNAGVFATPITMGSTAADLYCSANYPDGMYAGGEMGVLLHSTDNGATWNTRVTGMTRDIRALYFLDEDHGIALVDSIVGSGIRRVLHKTTDGGRSWTPAGWNGVDLTALTPVLNSTYSECLVAGRNGLVWRVLVDVNDQNELVVGIIPVTGIPSNLTPRSIWGAWVLDTEANANMLRCVVGTSGERIYWNRNISGTPYAWDGGLNTPETSSNAVVALTYSTEVDPMQLHGICEKANGQRSHFKLVFGTQAATTSMSANSTSIKALRQLNATTAVVRLASTNTLQRIELNYANFATSTPWATDALTVAHTTTVPLPDGSLVLAGNDGYLRTAPMGTNPHVDRSRAIRPVPLTAMDKSGTIAAGRQGTLYVKQPDAHWKAVPTRHVQDLRALHLAGNTVVAVGDAGTAFKLNPATPATVTDIALPLTTDLMAVCQVNNTLTIGTTNGTALYTTDHTLPAPSFSVLPHNSGTLHALAPRPSSTEVTAVGDGALVHAFEGAVRSERHDVYTPPLRAVDFHDGVHGYAVGNNRIARYTADGGQHWHVVPGQSTTTVPLPNLNAVDADGPNSCWMVGAAGVVAKAVNGTTWSTMTVTGVTATTNLYAVTHANSGARMIAGEAGGHGRYFRRDADPSAPFVAATVNNNPLYAAWAFEPYYDGDDEEVEEDILIGGANGYTYLQRFVDGAVDLLQPAPTPSAIPGNPELRTFWFHDRVVGYAAGPNGSLFSANDQTDIDHGSFGWDGATIPLTDNIDGQTFANCDINTIGFSDRFNGFVGGRNATGIERYARTLRDEMGLWSQRYWYDKVGRIVLSQNTKQKQGTPERFTYTFYDALARAYEAGEVDDHNDPIAAEAFRNAVPGAFVGGSFDPSVLDADQLKTWVTTRPRREVTRTWYDEPLPGLGTVLTYPQQNLRLRVASTTFQEVHDEDPLVYAHATHYSYDIHGNVASLIQDHPQMDADAGAPGHRFKKMFYTYDLISGNVKEVWYQHRKPDAMYHRYTYDADNRLIEAETSTDRWTWYTDAEYFYYPHGPLERVELGENKVQGIDYAYTLQGWLKAMNSDRLVPSNDMGRDGLAGTVNEETARDAFGESIGYYGEQDYAAIDEDRWSNATGTRPVAPIGTTGSLSAGYHKLYNGNIAHTVNTLSPFPLGSSTQAWTTNTEQGQVLAQVYQYDQLNRLRESKGVQGMGATNTWNGVIDATNRYQSVYEYDANGNITSATRRNDQGAVFDDFTYKYNKSESTTTPGTADKLVRNRLYQLFDDAPGAAGPDIVNTPTAPFVEFDANINSTANYRYDQLGNLIHDTREQIENIEWTVAGKVKSIARTTGSTREPLNFGYGASGQRIMKQVADPDDALEPGGYREHYIRDAQGNIMATYKYTNPVGAGISLRLTDRPIYGSSRLGNYVRGAEMYGEDLLAPLTTLPTGPTAPMHPAQTHYELTDHLGNVTATVTGQLLPDETLAAQWQPKLLSAQGYEPFGSLLPGRNYSSGSYRYLFQGQEHDDEINGSTGTSYAFEYRIHDPRIGRFLSIDPLAAKYPHNSPYAFSENQVIAFIELEGLEKETPPKPGTSVSGAAPATTTPATPAAPAGYVDGYQAGKTTREIGFAVKNPIDAARIGPVAADGTSMSSVAQRLAAGTGVLTENAVGEGSQVNAMRHTLWQSMITNRLGVSTALQVGNAHETNPLANITLNPATASFPSLALADQSIDLMNNITGRAIGLANPNANPQQLALKVLDQFHSTGLWVATANADGTYGMTQLKLTTTQYTQAKAAIQARNANGFTGGEQKRRDEIRRNAQRLEWGPKL